MKNPTKTSMKNSMKDEFDLVDKRHFVPDSAIKFRPPSYRELQKRMEQLDPIFTEARAALAREIEFQKGIR